MMKNTILCYNPYSLFCELHLFNLLKVKIGGVKVKISAMGNFYSIKLMYLEALKLFWKLKCRLSFYAPKLAQTGCFSVYLSD